MSPGGAWRAMRNTYGAAWQLSGLPAPPWDFRITGSEQLVARQTSHPTSHILRGLPAVVVRLRLQLDRLQRATSWT